MTRLRHGIGIDGLQVRLVPNLEVETFKIHITMKKEHSSNNSKTQASNISVVRHCNNFDDFIDLMDEAKYSVKEIFFNGKKHDKRKTDFEDFEDVFDNGVPVKYFFNKNRLDIWIGNYSD